ncbi:carboxypeptidase M32 [Paenibacillus amylolyticus]|uniref:carboxypeptidase M32 n=1 Tax=Paenibacillus amylolyticus TaxID=1451 RepID=UPI00201E4E5D|nr:carboxypeptidase M32 [Paenibacillus amylolyticus]MCL6658927.1 carboxypeptidase M32 [Paenibacillus amylolyticus]
MITLERLDPTLKQHIEKIEHYKQVQTLLAWDARTGAPKKGASYAARAKATLAGELFRLQTDSDFGLRLEEETQNKNVDELTGRIVAEHLKAYKRWSAIPIEEYQTFVHQQGLANAAWLEARAANDFSIFAPHLKQIFDASLKFAGYWGYEKHVYDPLVQQFDPDLDTVTLNRIFSELKSALLPLIRRVVASSKQPDTSIFTRPFPLEEQRQLGIELLDAIRYDFDAGQFGATVHPFSSAINPYDARLAAKFVENDVRVSLWSALHEGGHSLYTQNINPDLIHTGLGIFTSYGIHESQSIFYEKFIGRHKGFWENNYLSLQKIKLESFGHVNLDDFYFALNAVKPTFNRFEADELTYNLHLIIRYELEQAIIAGEVDYEGLPDAWNDKYEEYLGVRPPTHLDGVLQDGHWSAGFGLFPSYTLGFVYAAQLHEAIRRDLPDYDHLIESDNIETITGWLTTHVHQFGKSKSADELIQSITGKGIDSAPLIQYLTNKYEQLYEL